MMCDVLIATIMAFSFKDASWHEIKVCVDDTYSQMWELDATTGEEVNTYQVLIHDKAYFIIDEGECYGHNNKSQK